MPTHRPDVVSALKFYRVRPDTPITVQVVVGQGQAGGTVLHWVGGTETFPSEDRNPHPIGEDRDLTNTFLDVTTTVEDIREETNLTSVAIRLEGGAAPAEFPFDFEVPEDRGIVIYAIEFFLTS